MGLPGPVTLAFSVLCVSMSRSPVLCACAAPFPEHRVCQYVVKFRRIAFHGETRTHQLHRFGANIMTPLTARLRSESSYHGKLEGLAEVRNTKRSIQRSPAGCQEKTYQNSTLFFRKPAPRLTLSKKPTREPHPGDHRRPSRPPFSPLSGVGGGVRGARCRRGGRGA